MSTPTLHPVADPDPEPGSPPQGRDGRARRARAGVERGLSAVWWRAVWPVAKSVAASPGWARAAGLAAALVCRWQVQLAAAAALLLGMALCWAATPSAPPTAASAAALLTAMWWLGALLVTAGVAMVSVPVARAAYAHTIRGRVRARYGLDGWASWWDLHRYVSAAAVRQIAVGTRPSLADQVRDGDGSDDRVHPGRVARLPVGECGTWLGRSVVGPIWGTECYAAKRDVVGLLAPPQTGKTATLGHHVLDHRGPAVVTSTKTDLFENCAGTRAEQGPVSLFNPENLGEWGSTMSWSPVTGCADAQIAQQRAGYLVGATAGDPDKGEDRWDEWATAVLRALLLAAAISGHEMDTVARWVLRPSRDPAAGGAGEALEILRAAPAGTVPAGAVDSLWQVLASGAHKTTESIFLTLSRSVQFMTDPTVARLALPQAGVPEFDVDTFLSSNATVFLVGSERQHGSVAPLLAAFTGYVFESAKTAAARREKGRLDPPLGLFLDEVALISPVALDRWIPDSGGRGIHLVWAVQSPSQLVARWGRSGADTIWNATNAKLIYGGFTLDEDLEPISTLCGYRHETVRDPDGRERYERVRTCPPDRLRVLPEWHAVLIHRATPATIVRTSPVWTRKDLRPPPQVAATAVAPPHEQPHTPLPDDDAAAA